MFLISKAVAAAVDISIPCISCNNASGDNPVGLIADFYELALALSGVLALGMIIYAGILRVTSANNPSKVSESNDIIFNALLGIVLLFGAYILLNTINPELTKLEIPKLSEIKVKEQEGPNPDTNVYCGNKKSDGTISTKCPFADDKCVDKGTSATPRYACEKSSEPKHYYGCMKPGDIKCNGTPVAVQETLKECERRCAGLSGYSCSVQNEICGPQ